MAKVFFLLAGLAAAVTTTGWLRAGGDGCGCGAAHSHHESSAVPGGCDTIGCYCRSFEGYGNTCQNCGHNYRRHY